MKTTLYAAALLAVLTSFVAQASDMSNLKNYFDARVSRVDRVVSSWSQPAGILIFQDMNIDLAPEVGFGLNSVLSLSVSPEIDFVLTPVGG